MPRPDVTRHYSCRHALAVLHQAPDLLGDFAVGRGLKAVIDRVFDLDTQDVIGVTGSFLVGCFTERSDVDLVCYGPRGYDAVRELFSDRNLIRPYEGDALTRLYLRRAKYMPGSSFDALMRQEPRKLSGLMAGADAHVNCEPFARTATPRSQASPRRRSGRSASSPPSPSPTTSRAWPRRR
ncbi:nucleotidyltransferase domain-containing protein [Streptomyces sp. NPDC056632]|uniref:nucleotidyltransferase domain-containing protein n=1 Tax=Streptomyces sp. NPDC056632 TaxID=3345884 RepID=UPI0036CF8089